MPDLISRAAACECIGKMIHEYREKDEHDLADGMILARRYGIKCLPAVDAVPVVRCRDCVYWDTDWKPNHSIDGEHFCPMISLVTSGEWFCAYGERRESE